MVQVFVQYYVLLMASMVVVCVIVKRVGRDLNATSRNTIARCLIVLGEVSVFVVYVNVDQDGKECHVRK